MIKWLKRMFPLLLLQDLTNRFFLSIAFTASANVPTIYIHQFWNTLVQDAKTGAYNFQLDEQWFTLNVDLLRKALEITHVDSAHPFESPPAGEQVMDFVNELGYLEEIHFVSKIHVENLYQPWRAILSLINQCLTRKTSGNDKPRNLVLQMLWPTSHVIPYCRFTKLIIYYLGSEHNIHRRPRSPVHVTGDDFLYGNLKFVPKGEKDEVFGKPIPQELIMEAIQNSPYYQQYLEMVARKPTTKKGGQKKTTSKTDKPKKPALAEQKKPEKEKTSKPSPSKKIRKGKVIKVCKGKRTDHLVDEEDEEPQPVPEILVEDDEYNLQRGITQRLPVVEGKGKGISIDKQVAQSLLELHKLKNQSTTDQYIFQRRIPVTQYASTRPSAQPQDDTSTNVVCDTPSPADVETGADTEKSNSKGDTKILNIEEERGENISNIMAFEERTVELDEGQAGSDPGKTPESRPPPKRILMEEDQAGSNPGQSHVHTTDEHIHIENPLSSSESLSSMKNLDDALTFGDQFLNDKPTKEELGKANVETNVESMVTIPIRQASSSAPPLSTPIIDLTPPKPVSPPAQEPVFTTTTATITTITLPLPPHLPQQSATDPALDTCVSALEKICANFEKKHELQDKTTQALSSRFFTLENYDPYSKIENYVNETVKEAVHNALQAPIRDRFRELSKFEMKEILHDQIFESGSYRSHPEHATLYEALEASMDRETGKSSLK
ncbi:hypothetical protein Tco_0269147 [Tanacetum coccineum]